MSDPVPPNPAAALSTASNDALLRAMRQLTPCGILATDAALRITGWNEWLAASTGVTETQMLGKGLLEVFPDLAERRLDSVYRQALEGQASVLSERLHEYLFKMPAGAAGASRHMRQSARIAPLIDGDRVIGTLTIVEDVTERVAHDNEVAKRARQQTALAELAQQALSGCALEELEDAAERLVAKEDQQFVQTLAHLIGMAVERKRLEAELRQRVAELADADRRKDEFLAMLAHELRNPLAPVLNAVQFLAMTNGAPGSTDANVEAARGIIDQQVRQMARIVDDLLDVSRITRGRIALRLETVDLTALVSKAIQSNRPQFVSRDHRLTVSLPEGPLTVRGDITRLEQVITNLLNNAAKYTADGGDISVTLDRHGDRARLRVRDNGVGISPDMLPRIFDLFTQAEQSLARSHGGLGIGLTLVHRLVELHGGTVSAQSPGLNQGSEFTVELPLIVTAAPELQPNITDACPTAPRRKVLVVDDNVDAANSLAMLLAAAGHDARAAYNGPEALDHVAASPPEVVFLDIGLPGMDGFEVARRLRSGAKSPPLLLVALTGYGQPEDRESTRRAGFDRHLVKPVTLDRLENLLRDLDKQ